MPKHQVAGIGIPSQYYFVSVTLAKQYTWQRAVELQLVVWSCLRVKMSDNMTIWWMDIAI